MSERGKIIRGAGGLFKRNTDLGVGIGHPYGGEEGEIRVQMVDGSPRLYARAGGQWYGVGLEEGVADEFTIGSDRDHVKISPDSGITIINDHVNVAALGKVLRIGLDSVDASALRVASDGAISIGIKGAATPEFQITAAGELILSGAVVTADETTTSELIVNTNTLVANVSGHAGEVGIGTATPARTLHVKGGEIRIDATSPKLEFYDTEDDQVRGTIQTIAGTQMKMSADGKILLAPANSNAMILATSGKVGINIGATEPAYALDVESDAVGTTGGINLRAADDATVATIYEATTGDGAILLTKNAVGGTVLLLADGDSYFNGGNVTFGHQIGIGTNTPAVDLDIEDTETAGTAAGGNLRLGSNDGTVMLATDRLGVIEFAGAEDDSNTMTVGARIEAVADATWAADENGASLDFYTTDGNASQTQRMTILATGEVGVGVEDPDTPLEIYNASTQLKLSYDDTDTCTFGVDTSGYLTITPSGNNVLYADAVTNVRNTGYTSNLITGTGWGVVKDGASYALEIDDLYVRDSMHIWELVINQVRATNGSIMVSSSAKVSAAVFKSGGDASGNGFLDLDDVILVDFETGSSGSVDYHPFADDDLLVARHSKLANQDEAVPGELVIKEIRLQVTDMNFDLSNINRCECKVLASTTASLAPTALEGMALARIGSTTDAARQGGLYLTSDDSGAPFIDVWDDVNSFVDWDGSAGALQTVDAFTQVTHNHYVGTYTGVALTTNTGSGSGAECTVVVEGTGVATGGYGESGIDTIVDPCEDHTMGMHQNEVMSGGSGSGALATLVVLDGSIAAIGCQTGGTGYAVDDILTISASAIGGTCDVTVRVSHLGGPITSCTITAGGTGYAVNDELGINLPDDDLGVSTVDVATVIPIVVRRARFGKLDGITGATNDYGMYAGPSATNYIKASSGGIELHSDADTYTKYTGSAIQFFDTNKKMDITGGNITMYGDNDQVVSKWDNDALQFGADLTSATDVDAISISTSGVKLYGSTNTNSVEIDSDAVTIKSSAADYVVIDSDGMDIYEGGQLRAIFGATSVIGSSGAVVSPTSVDDCMRIGPSSIRCYVNSTVYTTVSGSGLKVYKGHASLPVAQFSDTTYIGAEATSNVKITGSYVKIRAGSTDMISLNNDGSAYFNSSIDVGSYVKITGHTGLLDFRGDGTNSTGNISIGNSTNRPLDELTDVAANINNVAIGNYTINESVHGANNVAIGNGCMRYWGRDGDSSPVATTSGNVAIGQDCLQGHADDDFTRGWDNVAIGDSAMKEAARYEADDPDIAYDDITECKHNVCIGKETGYWLSGTKNTYIGMEAGYGRNDLSGHPDSNFGYGNVGIGFRAMKRNWIGSYNVCIGYEPCMDTIYDQLYCIGIGYSCGFAEGINDYDQIAIGRGVVTNDNELLRIGNLDHYLEFSFESAGGTIDTVSDVRMKKDIVDTDIGLEFINALRPVKFTPKETYEYPGELYQDGVNKAKEGDRPKKDRGKKDGLIAQEVKQVMDDLDVTFSGWKEHKSSRQMLGYSAFVAPLIKAVQELSEKVTALEAQIN
tara:strand:+ start:231 stop:4880 length:4650 start_codon:yes stop_codon:yes gene_type:complete